MFLKLHQKRVYESDFSLSLVSFSALIHVKENN